MWGVELDSLSARILAKLYPNAQTFEGGFQNANIKNNSMDLVIGNVPFAKQGVTDNRYPDFSLHNYFFARSIDSLKPGGLMVAITSDSTMDAAVSEEAREYMNERADLVGAIRLPNTAFKENAQTEVTTDILVFRKKTGQQFKDGKSFVKLVGIKTHDGRNDVMVNEYYARNPDMMLGRMSLEGKMYGGIGEKLQRALLPFDPAPEIEPLIEEAFKKMPTAVVGKENHAYENETEFTTGKAEVVGRVGALVQVDKNLKIQGEGELRDLSDAGFKLNPTKLKRANDYVNLKTLAQEMVRSELDPEKTSKELEDLRSKLNKTYDEYVKKHKSVNTSYPRIPKQMLQIRSICHANPSSTLMKSLQGPKRILVALQELGIKRLNQPGTFVERFRNRIRVCLTCEFGQRPN